MKVYTVEVAEYKANQALDHFLAEVELDKPISIYVNDWELDEDY
jgi:hypothetical protein